MRSILFALPCCLLLALQLASPSAAKKNKKGWDSDWKAKGQANNRKGSSWKDGDEGWTDSEKKGEGEV